MTTGSPTREEVTFFVSRQIPKRDAPSWIIQDGPNSSCTLRLVDQEWRWQCLDRLRVLGIAQSTLPALGYMQAGSGTCNVLLTASAENIISTGTWDLVKKILHR